MKPVELKPIARRSIEETRDGTLVFLACGCAASRMLAHPTGAAFLMHIHQACDAHAGDKLRSILKGELVSPFTRPLDKAC